MGWPGQAAFSGYVEGPEILLNHADNITLPIPIVSPLPYSGLVVSLKGWQSIDRAHRSGNRGAGRMGYGRPRSCPRLSGDAGPLRDFSAPCQEICAFGRNIYLGKIGEGQSGKGGNVRHAEF